MGNTLQEVEQIGMAIEPAVLPVLSVLATLPGMSWLSVVIQLAGPLAAALQATGGNVTAVAAHLDPTMPNNPALGAK